MREVRNAIITSATISNDDHGVLSAWVHLDYGGSGQGFGGYALYLPGDFKHSCNQANYAGHFIWRVMQVADVLEWSDLVGKTIRADTDYSRVHRIGHIVKDDWFAPTADFEAMRAAQEAA